MSRILVVGAGVVGQSYAALLAVGGHEMALVARGSRATQLRRRGLRVRVDDRHIDVACEVVDSVSDAGAVDVVFWRFGEISLTLRWTRWLCRRLLWSWQ